MLNSGLVLSVFPGIDLLGRAFEERGWCIVRGPDVIWGGDVRLFHPPRGVFEGVVGGPPCQEFSTLAALVRHNGHEPRFGNLIPEFERVVVEASPRWFVMENVRAAPLPQPEGYDVWSVLLVDAHVGGVQPRKRRISFGLPAGTWLTARSPLSFIEYSDAVFHELQSVVGSARAVPAKIGGSGKLKRAVIGDARRGSTGSRPRREGDTGGGVLPHNGATISIEDACEAMGLPRDFTAHMPFTMHGKRSAIGNGVPMSMGRAIAAAIRRIQEEMDSG